MTQKNNTVAKVGLKLLLALTLVTLFTFSVTSFFVLRERYFPKKFRSLVIAEAKAQNVDPLLIAAVIFKESRFGPKKVSKTGDMGLMQVQPETLHELTRLKITYLDQYTKEDLFKPRDNVKIGITYLRYLSKRVLATKERENKVNEWFDGDPTTLMLYSYNAGPTIILRDVFDPANNFEHFSELIKRKRNATYHYAKDILNIYDRLSWIDQVMAYE